MLHRGLAGLRVEMKERLGDDYPQSARNDCSSRLAVRGQHRKPIIWRRTQTGRNERECHESIMSGKTSTATSPAI